MVKLRILRLLTAAALSVAAVLPATVSVHAEEFVGRSVTLAGRKMNCGKADIMIDRNLPSEGGAGETVLILNPNMLNQQPPTVRLFVFTHECGHISVGDSELDAVSGLRLGADDYLTKDLSLTHLMARVTALFRRIDALTQPSNRDQVVTRGPLLIDTARLHATWQEKPLGLTLTEFWIVHALAKNPGHVKNRQQLMDAANVVLDDNTITSHIKRIRRKFQAIEQSFDSIETMYGMGYGWKE